MYGEISDNYSEHNNKIIENKDITIEEAMKKVVQVHEQIKFKSFGKVTVGENNNEKEIVEDSDDHVDEESMARSLYEAQVKRTEDEIEEIKDSKYGKVKQVWNIRNKVIGLKKNGPETSAITNPDTGKLAVTTKEIKETVLKYCKETLANNPPEVGFEEKIEEKRKVVQNFLSLSNGFPPLQ